MAKVNNLSISTSIPSEDAYFIHCKVPFALNYAFKEAVGYWMEWDESNAVWLVENKAGEWQGINHFLGLIDNVDSPPNRFFKKNKDARKVKVSIPDKRKPIANDESLPSVGYSALQPEEVDAIYNDDDLYYDDVTDIVEIKATQIDTGYGLITAIGPDGSFPYGKRTQYSLFYEPHGATSQLKGQFVLCSGQLDWEQLVYLSKVTADLLDEYLSEAKQGEIVRFYPKAPHCHVELSIENSAELHEKATGMGITFHLRPAFGHSAGIGATSLFYFPSGNKEARAFLSGLGSVDFSSDESIVIFHDNPWRWLAGEHEKRHALNYSPTFYHKQMKLVFHRASFDRASLWVKKIMNRLAN